LFANFRESQAARPHLSDLNLQKLAQQSSKARKQFKAQEKIAISKAKQPCRRTEFKEAIDGNDDVQNVYAGMAG
jgi:transcriptional/translational regulatory protein YebC/TACO1